MCANMQIYMQIYVFICIRIYMTTHLGTIYIVFKSTGPDIVWPWRNKNPHTSSGKRGYAAACIALHFDIARTK